MGAVGGSCQTGPSSVETLGTHRNGYNSTVYARFSGAFTTSRRRVLPTLPSSRGRRRGRSTRLLGPCRPPSSSAGVSGSLNRANSRTGDVERTFHSSTNSSTPICSLVKSASTSLRLPALALNVNRPSESRYAPQANQFRLVLRKQPRHMLKRFLRVQPMLQREARRGEEQIRLEEQRVELLYIAFHLSQVVPHALEGFLDSLLNFGHPSFANPAFRSRPCYRHRRHSHEILQLVRERGKGRDAV